jgi:predicted ATPase/signal transduction histidine kinase
MEIPGYKIIEKIHGGVRLSSFRALNTSDRQRVVIRTTNHESHHFLLEAGYDIARHLDSERVVTPIDLGSHNGLIYLVLEDFGARPLSVSDVLSLSVKEKLVLFIKIIESLFYIHEADIIHHDINPDNIWWNPETNHLKIDGFGLAARKEKANSAPEKYEMDPYQVAYMSPEQTGRTNMNPVRTTDLYSLGCCFYQFLTGAPPFTIQDTLELIYCHLASTPRWPHQVTPQIPEPVSDIIMKLLEKKPGNRYQSCSGLKKDFETCLDLLEKESRIQPFTLGQHDLFSELCFSETLYGRDEDIHQLILALKENRDAGFPFILVSGQAGVGKSSIVEQALKQSGIKGYIITGKHDRVSKQGAVRSAFESLTLQILNQGKTRIEEWKQRILAALGNNAPLILDLVPMLEFIIGKQSPALKLNPLENDVRMNIVIRKFIETIVFSQTSLIFFLDDLQWVEPETLRILKTIELSPIRGFHLICTYRETETDSLHPFIQAINKIKKNGCPIHEIHLGPLNQETQSRWMSALFKKTVKAVQPFSALVFQKTGGNPFFIKRFLTYLVDIKLLYQDTKRSWHWDLKRIKALPVTDHMDDFMATMINPLDPGTMDLLKTASCLGSSFPVRLLEMVCGKNHPSFPNALAPALHKGILIQDQDRLKFAHDLFRDSVYETMPEPEKKQRHLQCGRKILEMAPEAMDGNLFIAVDQMNAAGIMLSAQEDRTELALLNLRAGQKKKELSSLQAADRYFQTGLGLLPIGAWVSHYQLMLSLFSQRCEILYALGNIPEAEYAFHQILAHAQIQGHIMDAFEAKSTYLMQAYRAQEAIETGFMILSRFDYPLPPAFNRFYIFKEILQFKKQTLGKKVKDLINLPEMTDPRQEAIVRILLIILRACSLNGHPHAMGLLIHTMNYVLKHGINPYSAYLFSFYGAALSNQTYDLKNGLEYGKLAMAIVDKFNAEKQEILTRHLFIVISLNCLGKTRHHIDKLSAVVKKSLNSGMFMDVCSLCVLYFSFLFISGSRLETLEQKMLAKQKQILDSGQVLWMHNLELLFQVIRALMGKEQKKFLLDTPGDIHNETMLETWEKTQTIAMITDYYLYRQIISYFTENPEASLDHAQKGSLYFRSFVSLTSRMTHIFFYTLALFDRLDQAPRKSQTSCLKMIRKNYRFFKLIHRKAPENNPHLFFLITAERARIKEQDKKAFTYYEKAMTDAKKAGYIHVEALCCELAGKFYLKKGNQRIGQFLIFEAAGLYRKWGVPSKAAALEHQYDRFSFGKNRVEGLKANAIEFRDIDIYSVLKASQAISGEIKPQKLMRLLIQLILKNSGAQRAFLLLDTDHMLKIDAFAQIHPDIVKILEGIPLEEAGNRLAKSIVYAVFLSKKTLILDNASAENRFFYDPYITETRPVSVLCMPVMGQKKIQGVLYLENNLISGAFTRKHIIIIEILISQVIISIENSRLYEKLRREIKKQVLGMKKIQAQQIQLKKMSLQLTQTEERERKAIADNLHDSVTQSLALTIAKLKSIKEPNRDEMFIKIAEARKLLEESLAGIRSLTFQLSSPILYDVGLEAALQWLCEDFFQKYGLPVQFINSSQPFTIPDETTKITLYRISQELLMNIIKHSQAKKAIIIVSCRDRHLTIRVEDNGIGFESSGLNRKSGFGLFSISERMNALGGSIQIDSSPGKGARIQIKAPLTTQT